MRILQIFLLSGLLLCTSCVMVRTRHDNGKHKGWFKNTNNPHNPAHSTATNAGNGNGNGKSKGKGKSK